MARVLIIDDDVTLRVALTRHLELGGHTVRQAGQGDEGVRKFEHAPADVVLVDIFMPVQGGLHTIDQLRQRWPEVKIIAMTGVPSVGAVDVKSHAIALGADRFLSKPLDAEQLLALIKELVEGLTAP